MLTAEQMRGARAMLGWKQSELAKRADVSLRTVARLELSSGPLTAYSTTVDAIECAMESVGVIFLDDDGHGAGVRLLASATTATKRRRTHKRRDKRPPGPGA